MEDVEREEKVKRAKEKLAAFRSSRGGGGGTGARVSNSNGGGGDQAARVQLEMRLRVEAEELHRDAQAALERSESQCGRLRELLASTEADLVSERDRLSHSVQELTDKLESEQRRSSLSAAEVTALGEQLAVAKEELGAVEDRARAQAKRIAELEAENASLGDSVGGLSSKLWTVNNELETARAEVRELRAAARARLRRCKHHGDHVSSGRRHRSGRDGSAVAGGADDGENSVDNHGTDIDDDNDDDADDQECAECAVCTECNSGGPGGARGAAGGGGTAVSVSSGAAESQEAYLAEALFGGGGAGGAAAAAAGGGGGASSASASSSSNTPLGLGAIGSPIMGVSAGAGAAGGTGASGGGSLMMSILDPRGNEDYKARQELLSLRAEVDELERRLGSARVRCARVEEERDNLTSSLRGNIHGLLSQVTALEREAGELRQENARLTLLVQDYESGEADRSGMFGATAHHQHDDAHHASRDSNSILQRQPAVLGTPRSSASSSSLLSSPSSGSDEGSGSPPPPSTPQVRTSGTGQIQDGLPRPAGTNATGTPAVESPVAASPFPTLTPARLDEFGVARATSGSPLGLGQSPDPRATIVALQSEVSRLRAENEDLRSEVETLRGIARDMGLSDAFVDRGARFPMAPSAMGGGAGGSGGGGVHPTGRVLVPVPRPAEGKTGAAPPPGIGSEGAGSFLGFVFRSFWKILDPGFDARPTGPERSV